jgi:hypothetical protein
MKGKRRDLRQYRAGYLKEVQRTAARSCCGAGNMSYRSDARSGSPGSMRAHSDESIEPCGMLRATDPPRLVVSMESGAATRRDQVCGAGVANTAWASASRRLRRIALTTALVAGPGVRLLRDHDGQPSNSSFGIRTVSGCATTGRGARGADRVDLLLLDGAEQGRPHVACPAEVGYGSARQLRPPQRRTAATVHR